VLESVLNKLIDNFLLCSEFIKNEVSVALSDSDERNFYLKLLSESVFDTLSISRDSFSLSNEEDHRSENGRVFFLFLFFLSIVVSRGNLFSFIINCYSFWNFCDFELFLSLKFRESEIAYPSSLSSVFVELEFVRLFYLILNLL